MITRSGTPHTARSCLLIVRQTPVVAIGLWLALVIGFAPATRERIAHRSPIAWQFSSSVPEGTELALVAVVVDGDTLRLADSRTVRVLGLDTPETNNPAMDGPQPLGAEAAERMRQLVAGGEVRLEPDVTDRDRYGRILRHVWVGRRVLRPRWGSVGSGSRAQSDREACATERPRSSNRRDRDHRTTGVGAAGIRSA